MRGFVGIGQSDNIETAIQEATSGLKNADLLVLVSPFSKAEKAAQLLSEKYPSIPMIGTTGASIAKGETSDQQIMVVAFAGVTVTCGIMDNISKAPVTSIKDFETALKSVDGTPDNTICMEFMTGNEEKTISTINTVLNRFNIGLCGSSAQGTPLGEQPVVIFNGRLYKKSCVYAIVKNNIGKIRIFKENIYEKLSAKAHFATLVDTNTKTLFQLDDTPAHEVYAEETGVDKDEIVENMINNPLGRALGDDIYITATTSLDMNGVMFNGKVINENDSIYIMQLGDFRQIHQNTIHAMRSASNRISFVFSFDSINRLKLFAREDYMEEYVSSTATLGTNVTFLGDGQQYNTQHMNQTLVCAVFE